MSQIIHILGLIIDKIDMHIALELGQDIRQLAKSGSIKPTFKTIITTNQKDEKPNSDYET